MKLNIVSDAHFEWGLDPKLFADKLEPADVLILAGDMTTHPFMILMQDFLDSLKDKFSKIIYVLGNHEFYGCEDIFIAEVDYMNNLCHPNLSVLADDSVVFGGVNFVGTTLWTDFDGGKLIPFAKSYLADYELIKHRKECISAGYIYELHEESLLLLGNQRKPDMKNVAIVHHSPSYLSNQGRYKKSSISGLFHSEVNLTGYDLVVHGHTHESVDYIHPLGYRVVSNQVGYQPEFHYKTSNFIFNKIVEI